MMLDIINAIKNATEWNVYAVQTESLDECVVYNFHTTLDDSIVQRIRLQITIIGNTMQDTLVQESKIKNAILTLGDEAFSNNILQVEINGGGTLYDTERRKHHRIMYFEIIKRSE